jgi:hypothetical protein
MPRSITDKFSRRRNEIEAKAAAKGIVSPEGKHGIGYYSREHKTLDQGKEELRREWDARLSNDERAALKAAGSGTDDYGPRITPQQAMQHAMDHTFERSSTIPEKRLKAEALRFGVGSVLPEQIDEQAKRRDLLGKDILGERIVTSKQVLEGELTMLEFAKSGRGKFRPFAACLEGLSDLTPEQKAALMHILASRDQLVGVRGAAGTGKTHMMKATIEAIEQGSAAPNGQRSKVFVFAPSAQASRGVLRGEGFAEAETLERLLVDKQLQEKTRGHVLWVDEAGLISAKDMVRLLEVTQKGGNRLILSGDYKQHGPVGAGDGFRLLEAEAGVRFAELTTIRRQREPGYRNAVSEISKGNAKSAALGFDRLDDMGAVIEASGDERHGLLIKDYLEAVEDRRSALIIAPTHREGEQLTSQLREALKERGALGKERSFVIRESTNWTEAERRDARNYSEPGMVVEFHQNTPGKRMRVGGKRVTTGGFTRGECAAVIGQEGGNVLLQRVDGSTGSLPADKAGRFQVYRTRQITVAEGDRLRITQNGLAKQSQDLAPTPNGTKVRETKTRINNGDIFTVDGFTKAGDIKLSNGKVLPKGYGHFGFGYIDTSYASQGKTVDRVFVSVGNESLRAANQQQWYVSVSRGRDAAKIYVDSKEDVREAIQRSGARLSAVELTKAKPAEPKTGWRSRLYSMVLERNRIGRFMRAQADAWRGYSKPREQERGSINYG